MAAEPPPPADDAGDGFGETDWDEAMKKLNARQQGIDASTQPPEDDLSTAADASFRFAAPPPDAPAAGRGRRLQV